MSLRLTKFTWSFLVFLSVVGVIVGIQYTDWWYIAAAIAVIALIVSFRFNDHSIVTWIRLRRSYKSKKLMPEQAVRYVFEGTGYVWDGTRLTTYLEVTQHPYTLLTVSTNGKIKGPSLPLSSLRRNLVQYDIHTEDINYLSLGSKYSRATPQASVLSSNLGPVPHPLEARSLVALTLTVDRSIDAMYARTDKGKPPDGLARAAHIAAERMKGDIRRQGLETRSLSSKEVQAIHSEVMSQVQEPLVYPGWTHCGKNHSTSSVTYSFLPVKWTEENLTDINSLGYHRQYTCVRMSRNDNHRKHIGAPNTDNVSVLVTYVTSDPGAFSGTSSYGLRRLNGQQRPALTRFLTGSNTQEVMVPSKNLGPDDEMGFNILPGGLGVYLGPTKERDRVFLSLSPSDTPLWVIGNAALAQQLVARISIQLLRINVMVDTPEWREFVRVCGLKNMKHMSDTAYDVAVMTQEQYEALPPTGKIVIIYAAKKPNFRPDIWVTAKNSQGVVESRGEKVYFQWEVTSSETAWLGAALNSALPQRSRV